MHRQPATMTLVCVYDAPSTNLVLRNKYKRTIRTEGNSPPSRTAPRTASKATAATAMGIARANQNPVFEDHVHNLRGGEETFPAREGGPSLLPTLPAPSSGTRADHRSRDDLRLVDIFRFMFASILVYLRCSAAVDQTKNRLAR